jgi:hypothetical protein
MLLALLFLANLSFAQETTTLTCYDGPEKLIEMPVRSAVIKKTRTEVVDLTGNPFTITNLKCSVN